MIFGEILWLTKLTYPSMVLAGSYMRHINLIRMGATLTMSRRHRHRRRTCRLFSFFFYLFHSNLYTSQKLWVF